VDGLVSAIETQMARLTSVLNAIQLAMVALTIASAVALLYSAYLFVFNPLAQLQAGLTRIGGGDFAARVEVSSTDEFGDLSAGFNQMAQTLQGLYQNLEAKVPREDRAPGGAAPAPGRALRGRRLRRPGPQPGGTGQRLRASCAPWPMRTRWPSAGPTRATSTT
jgi:HAMP domain-containing protein